MSGNKKENINNLFSEHGLDERQKLLSMELGFKSFKLMLYIVIILTGVWAFVYFMLSKEIPFIFPVFSYFIAVMLCFCIYAIRASKKGLINQPTSYVYSTSGLVSGIFCAVMVLVYGFTLTERNEFIAITAAVASIQHFVLYFCGRRNFKVLEEQAKEEE